MTIATGIGEAPSLKRQGKGGQLAAAAMADVARVTVGDLAKGAAHVRASHDVAVVATVVSIAKHGANAARLVLADQGHECVVEVGSDSNDGDVLHGGMASPPVPLAGTPLFRRVLALRADQRVLLQGLRLPSLAEEKREGGEEDKERTVAGGGSARAPRVAAFLSASVDTEEKSAEGGRREAVVVLGALQAPLCSLALCAVMSVARALQAPCRLSMVVRATVTSVHFLE